MEVFVARMLEEKDLLKYKIKKLIYSKKLKRFKNNLQLKKHY